MLKKITVTLKGQRPILMHNVQSMLLKKPAKYTSEEWEKSPEAYEAKMYLNGNALIIPSGVIKGLLISAAKKSGLRVPGKRKGYTDAVKAGVFLEDDAYLGVEKTSTDVKPETKFVTINKSKVMRVWPSVHNWKTKVAIGFDDEQISPDAILELIQIGGRLCGIGDYRPEYGRYLVESHSVEEL